MFDLDGPILDVSERYYCLYRDILTELGSKPLTKKQYWQYKRQRISEKRILACSQSEEHVKEYFQRRESNIESIKYLKKDVLYGSLPHVLHGLNKIGVCVILATFRKSRLLLDWELRFWDLERHFQHVVNIATPSASRARAKADAVRNLLQGDSHSNWFIGDTETDVGAGKILGINTAAVTFGIRESALLRAQEPDVILDSVEDFNDWIRQFQENK